MSKKRVIASVLVLVLMAILNVLIVRYYKIPVDEKKIELEFEMLSNRENIFELFYLGKDETEFSQENTIQMEYNTPGEIQKLRFEVPVGVVQVRLDFGIKESESTIFGVEINYKDCRNKLDITELLETIDRNDIVNVSGEETLQVSSQTGDPFLVWDTDDWDLREIAAQGEKTLEIVLRILICVCIDIIFLVALVKAKELKSLPIELIHNRRLMFSLAKNDFKTKYAGSYLGIFWAFVQPIVTVLLYWFVFEKGLKTGGINTRAGMTVPFVLWLVAGLVPWFFFQDVLNGATNALIEYNYLVKKVVFKISILPIIKMISAFFVHVFFVGFMLALYVAMGYTPHWSWIQVIYYTMCIFMLTLGISYATCAIVVFFRDLSQIINIVLQIGTWMTPIMWNIQRIDLPPIIVSILKLNPMYYVVEGYRQALITNEWVWNNQGGTIYFWIVVAACFGIGSYIFKKLRVHFADVL